MIGAALTPSRVRYAGHRIVARTRQLCSCFANYEAEKAIWKASNPSATPAEYEQAMRAIARACGV